MFNRLIGDAVNNYIVDFFNGLAAAFFNFAARITTPTPLWEDAWAIDARNIVVAVAWSVLALRVTAEAVRLYVAREAGEPIIGPAVLFRRTLYAAMAIPATGWAVPWFVAFADGLSRAFAGATIGVDTTAVWNRMAQNFVMGGVAGIAAGISFPPAVIAMTLLFFSVFIVMALFLALIAFQSMIRGVELTIAFVAGPFAALSAAGSDNPLGDGFLGAWVKEVAVLAFTQAVQMLMTLAVGQYTFGVGFELSKMLLIIAILWVGFKTPTVLRGYVYSSGVSQMAVGTASHVLTHAMSKFFW